MESQQESVKILKHQQHLKLRKEEDESWISGEELRTEGSSDEELNKRNKLHKLKRKSKERRSVSENVSSQKNVEKCGVSTSYLGEESAWKPKRGSLKLPNLFEDNPEDCNQNFKPYTGFLPLLKLDDHKNKKAEIAETLASIDQLEKHIRDHANVLQDETSERLKIEEEMCEEIRKSKDFFDKDMCTFINQYCSKNTNVGLIHSDVLRDVKCGNNDHAYDRYKHENAERDAIIIKPNTKDFIRRNIELASTAMLKLPLTDEEKQQLDQILSDIDLSDSKQIAKDAEPNSVVTATDEINDDDGNASMENAFHFSKNDEKRMHEIDFQLDNNFGETQHLKSEKRKVDNFWKSLIMDQMLKEVDSKLNVIKQTNISLSKPN